MLDNGDLDGYDVWKRILRLKYQSPKECLFLTTGAPAQTRGFATDVGAKAGIGAAPLIQLSFMRTRPKSNSPYVE